MPGTHAPVEDFATEIEDSRHLFSNRHANAIPTRPPAASTSMH